MLRCPVSLVHCSHQPHVNAERSSELKELEFWVATVAASLASMNYTRINEALMELTRRLYQANISASCVAHLGLFDLVRDSLAAGHPHPTIWHVLAVLDRLILAADVGLFEGPSPFLSLPAMFADLFGGWISEGEIHTCWMVSKIVKTSGLMSDDFLTASYLFLFEPIRLLRAVCLSADDRLDFDVRLAICECLSISLLWVSSIPNRAEDLLREWIASIFSCELPGLGCCLCNELHFLLSKREEIFHHITDFLDVVCQMAFECGDVNAMDILAHGLCLANVSQSVLAVLKFGDLLGMFTRFVGQMGELNEAELLPRLILILNSVEAGGEMSEDLVEPLLVILDTFENLSYYGKVAVSYFVCCMIEKGAIGVIGDVFEFMAADTDADLAMRCLTMIGSTFRGAGPLPAEAAGYLEAACGADRPCAELAQELRLLLEAQGE
jgi:hypothetical protein